LPARRRRVAAQVADPPATENARSRNRPQRRIRDLSRGGNPGSLLYTGCKERTRRPVYRGILRRRRQFRPAGQKDRRSEPIAATKEGCRRPVGFNFTGVEAPHQCLRGGGERSSKHDGLRHRAPLRPLQPAVRDRAQRRRYMSNLPRSRGAGRGQRVEPGADRHWGRIPALRSECAETVVRSLNPIRSFTSGGSEPRPVSPSGKG
jgi:hypothetical protein